MLFCNLSFGYTITQGALETRRGRKDEMEQRFTFSEVIYRCSDSYAALKLLSPVCFAPGIYVCSKCNHQLFSSRSKFEHSSPWPAFTETVHENSVSKHEERPGAFKVREIIGELKEKV